MGLPSPSHTMKVLLLSTLVALVAADSCSDCTAVVSVISARMSSEESINQQIDMLVAGLCPESDDPAGCEAGLPDFWRAIAAILWPGYWDPAAEWMCGPTCAAPEGEFCSGAEDVEFCSSAADFVIRNGLPLLGSAADASQFPPVCNAAVEGTCPARRFAKLF